MQALFFLQGHREAESCEETSITDQHIAKPSFVAFEVNCANHAAVIVICLFECVIYYFFTKFYGERAHFFAI